MKKESGRIIYSASDLIRYLASPFASWLDRYHLENPDAITPDEQTDEEKVLSHAGDEHERIGVILGNGERVEFRVEDFVHYYRRIKESFLAMQAAFSGSLNDCPEPLP